MQTKRLKGHARVVLVGLAEPSVVLVGHSKHGVGANKPMECPFERPFFSTLIFREKHVLAPRMQGQTSLALVGLAEHSVALVVL